jgi:catechol 2,3-dioxygenase-like lactoylglutathione lyase family enzyme
MRLSRHEPMLITGLNHVNVTVPAALEEDAKSFYRDVLGLKQIEKPDGPRKYIGAWYDLGGPQIHLSIEDGIDNEASDRHVCYQVTDIVNAELHFQSAGIEIIPEKRPASGARRFFVRDPGGNLIEITEKTIR